MTAFNKLKKEETESSLRLKLQFDTDIVEAKRKLDERRREIKQCLEQEKELALKVASSSEKIARRKRKVRFLPNNNYPKLI